MRTLVVNADDFGFTRDVNSGIIEAHRKGILTATTLMANGAAFDDALLLAEEHPTLDIGVHLQMVQGESVLQPGRALPPSPAALIAEILRNRWNIFDELNAQIQKVLAAGIMPTHLDTHKHTHLLPPVLDAVARLSQQYSIPWVRTPFDFPLPGKQAKASIRLTSFAMRTMRGHFRRVLSRHGACSTDHFTGYAWTGNYTAADLIYLIQHLPEGSTELMTHPGHLGPELLRANTRLKESRNQELVALTDPRVREALIAAGVQLGGYRILNGMRQNDPKSRS